MKNTIFLIFCIFCVIFSFSSCDTVFTASPIGGLDRDPANMDLDEKIAYSEEALASGETEYMKKAYDALEDETTTNAYVYVLMGRLGTEICGIMDLLFAMSDDDSDLQLSGDSDYSAIDDFVNGMPTKYLDGTEDSYTTADSLSGNMNATDYLFAGIAELFSESKVQGGFAKFKEMQNSTDMANENTDVADIDADIPSTGDITAMSETERNAVRAELVENREELVEMEQRLIEMRDDLNNSAELFNDMAAIQAVILNTQYFLNQSLILLGTDSTIYDSLSDFNDSLGDIYNELGNSFGSIDTPAERAAIISDINTLVGPPGAPETGTIDTAIANIDAAIAIIDSI